MAKRLTDSNKWKNSWFRTLPVKAKLTWIYLCDECDFAGIWKCDFGLASFQLDFTITRQQLEEWFGDKIHFFGNNNLLVVPFYEFQYGESKDTWTAKIKARQRLENFGFFVENNMVVLNHSPTTVPPQSTDCLSVCVSVDVDKSIKGGVGEKKPLHEIGQLWNQHKPKELAVIQTTSGKRERTIKKIWPTITPEEWVETVKRIEKSDWLRGLNPASGGWKASFDWVLDNYDKVKEGNYDNGNRTAGTAKGKRPNFTERDTNATDEFEELNRLAAEAAGTNRG